MEKIKRSDMPRIRNELYKKQGGICPISGRTLPKLMSTNLCIDHDHTTGVVRAVLSKGINGLEGKVSNLLTRWGSCKTTKDKIDILRGLANYLELHQTPQTSYIYPLHKTPDEVRAARNKKARLAYTKKQKGENIGKVTK